MVMTEMQNVIDVLKQKEDILLSKSGAVRSKSNVMSMFANASEKIREIRKSKPTLNEDLFRSLESSIFYLRTVEFRKSLESEKSLKGLKMTGDFIRELREAAGVSQEELAARGLTSIEDVKRIENGEPYDSRGARGRLASITYDSVELD